MESPSEDKKRTHAITIDPDETVMTAFPYRPHNSLLDFLKGEPKVLGAIQIVLSLVIVGLGIIFAFNFIFFSKKLPLVVLAGYPYWGAFIFFLTGFVTMFNNKSRQILRHGVVTMNVFSSLAALVGIALTLLSFTQLHKFCQTPTLEGTCVVGRTLLLGILSVLLIITIAEFSISVTIASLRSRCWTSPREAVFFFPSEVAQNAEQPAPEESNTLRFEFQEKSSGDNTASDIKTVFLGGYAFFKLKLSRNLSAPKTIPQKSDKGTSSMRVPDGQETILPRSPEQEIKVNVIPPPLTPKSSGNISSQKESRTDHLNEEDVASIMYQTSDVQFKSLVYENSSLKILKTPSSQNFLHLPEDNLSTQTLLEALSTKDLQSKTPSLHISETDDLGYEYLPSEDVHSEENPSQVMQYQDIVTQDIPSQKTLSQLIPYQGTLFQELSLQDLSFQDILTKNAPSPRTPSPRTPSPQTPSPRTPSPRTPSPKTPSQGTPSQGTPHQELSYQDILTKNTSSQGIPFQKTLSQELVFQDILTKNTSLQETSYLDTPIQDIASQETPSQGTPNQDKLTQDIPSKETLSQETPDQDILTQDIPFQETQSEETPSQEIPSQISPSQSVQYQDTLSQDKISQSTQTQDTVPQDMTLSDLQTLNTQVQIQKYPEVFYRDIRTEVMELTQEWEYNKGKKTTRRLSLSLPGKHRQPYPKRHSLDLQIKAEKPRRHSVDLQRKTSRRKSIDQQIKAWLSSKKHTKERHDVYTQTSEQVLQQQSDDQQAKEEEVPLQESQSEKIEDQKSIGELLPEEQLKDRENEDLQSDKEQHTEEEAQVQPSEDQQPQEQQAPKIQLPNWQERPQLLVKRAPKQLCDDWDSQSFQFTEKSCSYWPTPSWQTFSQGSEDWRSQGWRNKDWKAQEWQFEMQHSLEWESQELLERESLRQRALYQQIQPHSTIVQQTPDRHLQNFIFQVGLCQGSDKQDSESSVLREDMYTDNVQARDREPEDTEDTCQNLKDQQSEDRRPDNYPAACQSLVPYTYVTCSPNITSEREVQNNTPCSNSSKDQRDQQQSEDSD
ncbi:membrane-spanning 4-domains subfamily A member 14 [Acomys russatus]|uniref:membrane-spanning 4-domains subfamily A member 14 n=1 Tax=Acomys russatus TaxID=60746 RepID=UPI0021E296F2|nr:membrane-spanning 4-domains subfamily A member 14 [Acomys russatus]